MNVHVQRSLSCLQRALILLMLFALMGGVSAGFAPSAHAQATVESLQKLVGATTDGGDALGRAIAIDGTVGVVGAPNANTSDGAVFVYRYEGGTWTETAEIIPTSTTSYDDFGQDVDISGDRIVVGANGAGFIFQYDGTQWVEEEQITNTTSTFGESTSINGDRVVISAYSSEDVFVYTFDGSIWSLEATLTASDVASGDDFGFDTSLGEDVLLVGSYREDDGGLDAGAAYVFRFDGTSWTEEAKLTASDAQTSDFFGESVSLSGNLAVIGAPIEDGGTGDPSTDSGAAYIFRFDGAAWSQETVLRPVTLQPDDNFGTAVAIDGNGAVVGTPERFGGGSSSAGAAFIYQFDGSSWVEAARLLASDIEAGDRFGEAVAISQNTVFAGAPGEDGGAGSPSSGRGATYVFGPPVQVIAPSSVQPGGAFDASVQLGSAAFPVPEALGVGYRLNYDPTRLTAASATAGAFLDDGDLVNDSFIDNPTGVTSIGVFRKGVNGPVSGSGVATIVSFQAPASAPIDVTAAITVSDVLSIDGDGTIVPVYPVAGSIDLLAGTTLDVWPGDTDNSGILDATAAAVDAADLLPIADCFDLTGPSRPGPFDISWGPKNVDPWTFPPADPGEDCVSAGTFSNPAYADATGDGTINQNDLSAVGLNFGESRSTPSPTIAPATILAVAPELVTRSGPFPTLSLPTAQKDQVVELRVDLVEPVTDLRGVALTIGLPPGQFRVTNIEPGALLDNGNLLTMDHFDPSRGELEIAAARKRGGAVVTGTGRLATVTLITQSEARAPIEIALTAAEARRRGAGTVGLTRKAVELSTNLPSTDEAASTLSIDPVAPHPIRSKVTTVRFTVPAGPVQLQVYDLLGRSVAMLVDDALSGGSHEAIFRAGRVAPGVYFLRLRAGGTEVTERITVIR